MGIEFDPAKNAANLAKHGLALADFRGFDVDPMIASSSANDAIAPLAALATSVIAWCLLFVRKHPAHQLSSRPRKGDETL